MPDIHYQRPELQVDYDGVAIVDGLKDRDHARWKVSEQLATLLQAASIRSLTLRCGNRLGALAAFKEICSCAESGQAYCIHIVAHGNSQGIGMGPTDFLTWREFGAALVPINRAMKGQLIVNMTACKGIHGIKSVGLAPDCDPFFGILGVKHDLDFDEALALNDRVYRLWFGGMPVNEIIRTINLGAPREILFCASAEGFRQASQRSSS